MNLLSICVTIKDRLDANKSNLFHDFVDSLAMVHSNALDAIELVVGDWNAHNAVESLLKSLPITVSHHIVKISDENAFSRGLGLNRAFAESKGDIVFFTDVDMILSAEVLNEGICHCLSGKAFFPICQSGLNCEDRSKFWWRDTGFGNVFVRREDFLKAGQWMEKRSWGGEDTELCSRLLEVVPIARNRAKLFHQKHPETELEIADTTADPVSLIIDKAVEKLQKAGLHPSVNDLFHKALHSNKVPKPILVFSATKAIAKSPKEDPPMQENISIVTTVYNKAPFLEECIQSVIKQTSPGWELCLVDDQSTDGSSELLDKYANTPSIRIYHSTEKLGCAGALDTAIHMAGNDIIGHLDADDYLDKNCVAEILGAYTSTGASFIYSNFWYCDEHLNVRFKGYCSKVPDGMTNLEADCISAFRTFRKTAYLKTTGCDRTLKRAIDKDLVYKLEEVVKPIFLDKILYYYRDLPKSVSRGNPDCTKYLQIAKENARLRRLK